MASKKLRTHHVSFKAVVSFTKEYRTETLEEALIDAREEAKKGVGAMLIHQDGFDDWEPADGRSDYVTGVFS